LDVAPSSGIFLLNPFFPQSTEILFMARRGAHCIMLSSLSWFVQFFESEEHFYLQVVVIQY
jgi:hypothetical protein